MTPILNTVPFSMWGIDLVGKLPKAKGSLEYAVVVVDYFSKWVEAAPLKRTGSDNIVRFLWKHVVTCFAVPRILISDNGPQFESEELAKFCEKYNREHRFSPVYYPQGNGQVEMMNDILFKGIKKNMIQSGSKRGAWVDELPIVLWSLRTTPSHATWETPFNLVYGSEAVLPVEDGLPTYRQIGFNEEENDQRMRERLNFVDPQFKVGDLVLSQYSITHPKNKDKLSLKWEGPYRMSRILGPGTNELEQMNGETIPRTWHASNLAKYYI
ncbi:hypothetical protein LIER_24301 [Lithospermum erythrorhizon]|uniref:Integrase catalytic domain-containing protein n=1 Tax=Lithospermum erythrorhizon TaxID=34254 RepID=A0AAV3R4U2_LITER